MAVRYYDDILAEKIKRWIPEESKLRVLKPNETKRLFETKADDTNDKPIALPCVALSRDNSIELLSNIKNTKSYAGLNITPIKTDENNQQMYNEFGKPVYETEDITLQLNVIPIKLEYQLDIYTKTYEDGDEYLRNFLFKLINNPVMIITIPYNNFNIQHTVNIRVLNTVTDNSDISERLFVGQFTRWTIQLELQDAFLFSIPYRKNWKLDGIEVDPGAQYIRGSLEVSERIDLNGDIEEILI